MGGWTAIEVWEKPERIQFILDELELTKELLRDVRSEYNWLQTQHDRRESV